jgi:hypothetical protein
MSRNAHLVGFYMQSKYLPNLPVIGLLSLSLEAEFDTSKKHRSGATPPVHQRRRTAAERSRSKPRPAEQLPTHGADLVETATGGGALRVHFLRFHSLNLGSSGV